MPNPYDSNDVTFYDDVDYYIASGKQFRFHGEVLVNNKAPDLTCVQTEQVIHTAAGSFSDIPGLAFPVFTGKRYIFEFIVVFQTAATTTGIGFTCSAPALTSGYWFGAIQSAASGGDLFWQQTSPTLGTLLSNGVVVADTDYVANLKGLLTPSEDGVLQLRCRTEVEASAVTVQNAGAGFLIECG